MLKTTLFLTTIFCAGAASATTMTFQNTYSNLNHSGPGFSDSFDLNSFVSNSIPSNSSIDIYSATISLSGYSSHRNSYSSQYTGRYVDHYDTIPHTVSYSCGLFRTCTRTTYTRRPVFGASYYIRNGDHVIDNIRVGIGSNTLSDSTYHPDTTTYGSGYLTRHTTNTGHSSGSVSDTDTLSFFNLASLNDDYILGYNVDVLSGVFDRVSVRLNINFNVVNNGPAPVPLPASVLLMGGALGGLSLTRRRKKPA